MQPITPLTLLVYVPAFLLTLALYGNPFRMFFEKHLSEKQIILDNVERVSLTLAFGSALIPLLVMVLTLLGGLLNVLTVWFLTGIFIMINLSLCRENIRKLKIKLFPMDTKILITFPVFLAIFSLHLLPSLGLFVHPGCDPALYSLVTLRIVESRGYATSWGSFAPLAWYQEITHLTIAGFAGICAFFHLLTGLAIEKAVFLITLMYTSSISLGVYFLAKRLFKNFRIALCSAFVFGMLIQEPSTLWFGWGGNAELSSLFLLPITIGLFWELLRNQHLGFKCMICIAFLVSGMVLLHPFSAFYLAFGLIPLFVVFISMHRKTATANVLKSLAILPLSILIILPVLITAVSSEMTIMKEFSSKPNPFWTPMLSWNQTPAHALFSLISRFLAVYGIGTLPLLIVSIDTLRHRKTQKEPLIFLAAWTLMIFLVHENNPNGLYLIPFPLWYRVDTNRTFTITSFAVSLIIGMVMPEIVNSLDKFSIPKKDKTVLLLKRILNSVSKSKIMLIVLFLCVFQLSLNVFYESISRENSPITDDDLSAFEWIKQNTSANATFFVSHNDAGYWIPLYTHRKIVIPFGVVTNLTLRDAYYHFIYPAFCVDPNDYWVLNFLNQHKVDYVYIGSKMILRDILPIRLNSTFFMKSPVFKLVYNQPKVKIFKYLGATFNPIWSDNRFLEGWTVNQGTGSATLEGYKLSPPLESSSWSISNVRIGTASHELQLDNVQNVTYILVQWRTTGNATYHMQITVNERAWIQPFEKVPNQTWTTSAYNLNSMPGLVGRINRISINVKVDGEGHGDGYTKLVMFMQLSPSNKE